MLNNKLKIYEKYMKRCIKLARKGIGNTSPNPLVGAVLLDENLNFISEGYHQECGQAHAEVNAIKNAVKPYRNATLIVNLEPCSHFGKTPPCADLIIKSNIKFLVVGCKDPNPLVSGNGIKKCQSAGIEVITGVLENKSKQLNEVFFKNQTENRPFIMLKTATTLDGKIATRTAESKWITSEWTRKDVQIIRSEFDAILTSSKTVISDNPQLNCRIKGKKSPIRVILDSNLNTSPNARVYNDDGIKVILVTTKQNNNKYPRNVEILTLPQKNNHIDLKMLVQKLYKKGLCSIMIEAGGTLNSAFLKEKLVDKIYQYIAPKIIGDNSAIPFVSTFMPDKISECIQLKLISSKKIGNDIRLELKPIWK